jgi:hypothetical protein
LIDWQSASIKPAFLYANEIPDFASLPEWSGEDTFKNAQGEQKASEQDKKLWNDA